MPTRGDLFLLDTSAAVPFLVRRHPQHGEVFARLKERPLSLAGHAAFETYSVLTRLPVPLRHDARSASELITRNFADIPFLDGPQHHRLMGELARAGIAGGSVYDGLVGAVAAEAGCTLVTCDRRALTAYATVGASVELLGEQ